MELLITNEDGSTTKFTEEMAVVAIKERDQLRKDLEDKVQWNERHVSQIHKIRAEVYDFFKERYDTGESRITCELDDVNELLSSIGTDKLKRLFTVKGTVSFIITDIEAEDEDDATNEVHNELTLEFNGDGDLDDWSVDVDDTREQ